MHPTQQVERRPAPQPFKALDLLGMNLHDAVDPVRDVEACEVEQMQRKLASHSEETNELFNLMAQQIKKRCEERVNMVILDAEQTPLKSG